MGDTDRFQRLLREVLGVLLPRACAGCGRRDEELCAPCRIRFLGPSVTRELEPGFVVHSLAEWDETTAAIVRAFKQRGRTGLARQLARPLRALTEAVAATHGSVALVAIPSRRAAMRKRGYHPVVTLLRAARLPHIAVLRVRAGTADQRGLGRGEREANSAGAFSLRRRLPAGVSGVLIVDDVVTTGATLRDARRALSATNVPVIGAITVLSTPRRISPENNR